MTRTSAEAVFAHWAKQPLEPARPLDAHASSEELDAHASSEELDAHASSEELAIDDAFTSTDGAVVEMTSHGGSSSSD
jgi:hypothetical protein